MALLHETLVPILPYKLSDNAWGVIDAVTLTATISPVLYFLVFRKMHESEERYRNIIQTSMDSFWLIDTEEHILDVNDAYCQLSGYTREELLNMRIRDVEAKETPELTVQHIHTVMTKGYDHFETQHRRKDGLLLDIDVSTVYRHDMEGGHLFVFLRDITERKKTEAEVLKLNVELEEKVIVRTTQLERAKLEVEQASRAKDEFLAAISHELKTPLNHILGFADLLKEGLVGELNAEQKDMAQDIFDAGSKQLAIVNSLIELARLQAGKVELQAEPQDPAKLLGEIAARHEATAQAAGLAFAIELAQGLGELPLDSKVVTHLLDQLLANAFKFTPSGGKISLVARRVPRTDVAAPVRIEANEYLELAVIDNGPGIAQDILPRLFQSFVQGDARLARNYQGTGIGLVLVRLLAELHGGGSAAQSKHGAGAKFLVWLPIDKQQP